MNILFLTASTGGGHVKAAQALMEHMERRIPGCRTKLVDALKYISPAVDRLITGTYLQTIRRAPYIYGSLYSLSEKDEVLTDLVKAFNSILAPRLLRIFLDESPDAVVCTHTIPLQIVCRLKKTGLVQIPVAGIVTDYTNHYFWKLDEADAFIVPHECIRSDMAGMGIRKDRIYPLGIPVSSQFTDSNVSSGSTGYKIPDKRPVILLMGGSLGLCNMRAVFASLLALDKEISIIAVTGHNEKLKKELEELSSVSATPAAVLGYTHIISKLMDAASIIITKPGGVTISEALVKRLPILIMDPIPGQEERNAEFLTGSGAALNLPNDETLPDVLMRTLEDPFLLRRMSAAAAKLAMPDACEDIARLILRLVMKECTFDMPSCEYTR
ncbi:MAG: UDP-N-acetylglucosamine--LPS N-acetylglucosamine transferase [Clostridiaceae bacterium]|nr:UDP-N-acetylglucosamine--LPS N-acetylglucosamine transferase [Clostridiaceae bacterium]